MSEAIKVETSHGAVRGELVEGVLRFKGIRYGASTGGENRFQAPKAANPWTGVADATKAPFSAPQLAHSANTDPFYSWYSHIEPLSEDCLFLSLFTPSIQASGKRPVMVWIHGGGWREYSGTAPGFDGSELAKRQDVVVVGVNHRLNVFGFLPFEESDERFADCANAGLLDIVLALKWIKENAAAFGGDPDNVTVFGQSGGASKLAALLAVPAAKGLFHKAILQSSAGGMTIASREQAAKVAAHIRTVTGVGNLDAQILQSWPVEKLIDLLKVAPGPYRAVMDGRTLFADPYGSAGPELSGHIPLLAGCTKTEFTYYLRNKPAVFEYSLEEAQRRLAVFLGVDEGKSAQLLDIYSSVYPGSTPGQLLILLTTDYNYKRNTYRIAGLHAAPNKAAVYAYSFDRTTPVDGGIFGAPHTSEVPFIFGTTEVAAEHIGRGGDIEPMTNLMMSTWASFARTGNPANALLPAWSPYSDGQRNIMILDRQSHLENDPGGEARNALNDLPYFGYYHSMPALLA